MVVTVLIAIDSSEEAEGAFEWYLEHLHRPGNVIVVLHSIDLSAATDAEENYASEASFTQMWHQQHTRIKQLEDKYRWKMNEQGIPGKTRTEQGKPGEIIIRVAKEERARLIVIGSRGLSRLKRTLQGSVSDYVLHHAACPVVICRQLESEAKRRASMAEAEEMHRTSIMAVASVASVVAPISPRHHASPARQPDRHPSPARHRQTHMNIPTITIQADDS